jgi:hypothetical protein
MQKPCQGQGTRLEQWSVTQLGMLKIAGVEEIEAVSSDKDLLFFQGLPGDIVGTFCLSSVVDVFIRAQLAMPFPLETRRNRFNP